MDTRYRSALWAAVAVPLLLGVALTTAVISGAPRASAATVVQTIPVGRNPLGISSDGTHVWVANEGDSTVTEIDALTGAVVQTIGVGSQPTGVSSDDGAVWLTNTGQSFPKRIQCLKPGEPWGLGGIGIFNSPSGISYDGTHAWVTNSGKVPKR